MTDRPSLWDGDLADFDEKALAAIADAQARVQANAERLVRAHLKEGVHYGIVLEDGVDTTIASERPFLWRAGAELLRQILRYHIRLEREPLVVDRRHFAAVTVEVGVYTQGGRRLATAAAHCNSREEFWRLRNKGWKYADAREVTHGCLVQAEKRGAVLATREGLCLTGVFANADEHRRVYAEAPIPKDFHRWTAEEAAEAKRWTQVLGMSRDAMVRLACELFGRPAVGKGDEAELFTAELRRRCIRAGKMPPVDPLEAVAA